MTKKLKISAEGRRCKFPDCRRVLSIYNHESYCRVHLEKTLSEDSKPKPYRHVNK